jgi:hypothetical protein
MTDVQNIFKGRKVNPAHLSASVRRDTIANEGWFKFAITKGENRVGSDKKYEGGSVVGVKEKRLQIVLTLAPFRNPEDPKSAVHELALKQYLILPDLAPDSIEPSDDAAEAKAQKDIIGRLAKNFRAIFGVEEIPFAPRKVGAGRYEYCGEEISSKEYEAAVKDLSEKTLATAYKMLDDEERWGSPKKYVYGKVTQQVQSDGTKRPNLQFITGNLPDGAELVDYKEWFKSSTVESKEAPF